MIGGWGGGGTRGGFGRSRSLAAAERVPCSPNSWSFVRGVRRVMPSRRAARAYFPPVYPRTQGSSSRSSFRAGADDRFSRLAVVRMSPHHRGRLAHQACDLQRLAEHAVQLLQVQRLAQVIVSPFRVRRGTVSSRAVYVARGGTRRAYSGSASLAPTERVT